MLIWKYEDGKVGEVGIIGWNNRFARQCGCFFGFWWIFGWKDGIKGWNVRILGCVD